MKYKQSTSTQEIVNYFFDLKGWEWQDPRYRPIYARWAKVATELLRITKDTDEIKMKILEIKKWAENEELSWNLGTVIKRWMEDNGIKKIPYSPDGDMMIEVNGAWKVKIHDGTLVNYNGNKSEIIWR